MSNLESPRRDGDRERNEDEANGEIRLKAWRRPLSLAIVFPNGRDVDGAHPLVIIGPNGSGKTRFGARLAKANCAG